MADEVGAFADVARPFDTGGQSHEGAVRFRPEAGAVERVGRAVEDQMLVRPEPVHALVVRDLIHAEETGDVDGERTGSTPRAAPP